MLNLVPQAGETDDYEPHELLQLLQTHAEPFGGLPVDAVLAEGLHHHLFLGRVLGQVKS